MADKRINIQLSTKADTTPLASYAKALDVVKGSAKGLGGVVAQVAEKFGGFGGVLGGLFKDLMRGGVWGVAISVVSKIWDHFQTKAEESAKAAEEAVERAAEKQKQAVDEFAAASEKAAKAQIAAADESLKRINAEIEATNKLAKATLELGRQRARAAGDSEAVAAADKQLAELDAETSARRAQARRDALNAREEALQEQRRRSGAVVGARSVALDQANAALARREAEIRAKAEASAIGESYIMQSSAGAFTMNRAATAADRARAGDAAVAAFRKTADYDALSAKVKEAQKAVRDAQNKSAEIRRAIEGVQVERANFETEQTAAAMSADIEAAKKAADEREKAEIAAAQAAAKERERLERELHQKRMADLRAELAAQKEAASALASRAASAQSEFDHAFALYRSPEAAANQRAEDEAYRADLERLHKDANRYGGKWRIDELSQLMAAGDTQGVSDTLASWRKSRSFTPEVEAMVRASAAEKTKTTAEDELRKLNDQTGELTQKIEQLAQTRDGKLDGIERNTNQLANKLDELLSVKG